MECPKCGGGAYLSEEDLVKVVENSEPLQIIVKNIYQCRACGERFSRIVSDTIAARKKTDNVTGTNNVYTDSRVKTEKEPVEGIRFF